MAKHADHSTAAEKSRKSRAPKTAGKSKPRTTAVRKGSVPSPNDWRAATLAKARALILAADPEITEERKWIKPTNPAGVAVWSHGGIVCTGEVY